MDDPHEMKKKEEKRGKGKDGMKRRVENKR
jgi:hypothetical protein